MDEKKKVFSITLLIVIILGFANVSLYYVKHPSLSGMAIKNFPKTINTSDPSFIIFMIQWVLIFLILIVTLVKILKSTGEKKNNFKLDENKKGITDLDVLYKLLQDKKKLKISSISKLFNVPKDKALEWGKILDNHNLAIVEYPAFTEPELWVKEEKNEKN